MLAAAVVARYTGQQASLYSLDALQVDFIVAFLGVTYARAVAAPLNPNYKLVRHYMLSLHACSLLLL